MAKGKESPKSRRKSIAVPTSAQKKPIFQRKRPHSIAPGDTVLSPRALARRVLVRLLIIESHPRISLNPILFTPETPQKHPQVYYQRRRRRRLYSDARLHAGLPQWPTQIPRTARQLRPACLRQSL
ncbi:hypothetical protein OE88DRAFT_153300 [Heliocybe sulcata]|uniref:Uncharacterized protein n=1 Tax=Heliocybe sulcata TaxID=5364 RepID=A0A5C3NN52_9AGAM|nr:hypothetical protein OE88DRAFT_153300 [Heliocybe sulcata]